MYTNSSKHSGGLPQEVLDNFTAARRPLLGVFSAGYSGCHNKLVVWTLCTVIVANAHPKNRSRKQIPGKRFPNNSAERVYVHLIHFQYKCTSSKGVRSTNAKTVTVLLLTVTVTYRSHILGEPIVKDLSLNSPNLLERNSMNRVGRNASRTNHHPHTRDNWSIFSRLYYT